MKRMVVIFALFLATGCAGNHYGYEAPLRQMGVLTGQDEPKPGMEIVDITALADARPGERPPLNTDEAGYWMVMDQAEEKLKTSGRLVRDQELNKYLQDLVCKLTPEYCSGIRVYLVRTPHFNANMAPNGAMQVWTGSLLRVQNEAQLAAVLGHEIGHYVRRHSLQLMRDAISKTSALVFVNIAFALAGMPAAGDLMQFIVLGSIQAFSRDMEREADGYGLAYMTRAGYDPREYAKIWAALIEENNADADRRSTSAFFASHPAIEERFQIIKEYGDTLAAKRDSWQVGEEPFNRKMQSCRSDQLRDVLHLRNYDRTEKLFDMLLARGGDLSQLHYFKGELYRLWAREGDAQRALVEYEAAAGPSAPPELYRSMGLLHVKAGERKKAGDALKTYLSKCPDAADDKFIQQMIQECE